MVRKGMFEWKILAAVFAVLIVTSSALVGSTGIKDFFLNGTGNLGDWVKGSPFGSLGSLFSTPQLGEHRVVIKLIVVNMSLPIENPVNITVGTAGISNFKGDVDLDFRDNSSTFSPAGSDIRLDMGLGGIRMEGVQITKLTLKNIDYVVTSEKSNITASDDNIEIYDFSGDIAVADHVLLTGNASRVKDGQWLIE
jgi:hypothetical protein